MRGPMRLNRGTATDAHAARPVRDRRSRENNDGQHSDHRAPAAASTGPGAAVPGPRLARGAGRSQARTPAPDRATGMTARWSCPATSHRRRRGRGGIRAGRPQLGPPDVLFNNAGRAAPLADSDHLSPDDLPRRDRDQCDGHVSSARARPLRRCGRSRPRAGDINNGSVAAHAPRAGVGRLYDVQACRDRPDAQPVAGRARVNIACGQIDVGNAATQLLREGRRPRSRCRTGDRRPPPWPMPSGTWPRCHRARTFSS